MNISFATDEQCIQYTSSPAPFHNGRLKPILSSMWESVPNVRLNLGSMENVSNDEQTGVITLTKSSRIVRVV